MKFFGKVVLALLLLLLLLLIACYVLLQSHRGADWISDQVNANSDYQLSFSKIRHHLSSPGHLQIDHLAFSRKGQPATLVAHHIQLGLSLKQFRKPWHFASIRMDQGTLNLSRHSAPLFFQADRLVFSQMTLTHLQDNSWPIEAHQVDGSIAPWQPKAGDPLGERANFQFSAGSLTLNGIPAANVVVQGQVKAHKLLLSSLGADVAMGSVTGSAQRDATGGWQVEDLRFNSIRLQSDKTLSDFLQPLRSLSDVHFSRIDLNNARLEGRNWAVTDLNLALKNITLSHGSWQSDGGSLSINASSLINGSMQLNDPIAKMDFSPQGITLHQFSSRWVNGLVRAQGNWTRGDKKITFNTLEISGLEYTLPADWRQRFLQTLPDWLASIEVSRLRANRNLLIDIDPGFPFQLTALEGSGSNLLIARNHQWGIWAGSLNMNATAATFNGVDLYQPVLALTADHSLISVNEMHAVSGRGRLEGEIIISQQPARSLSLSLNGQQVAVNLLHNWGWPMLALQGDANLQLNARAGLQQDQPLRPTVNATLTVTTGETAILQRMVNGKVAAQPQAD